MVKGKDGKSIQWDNLNLESIFQASMDICVNMIINRFTLPDISAIIY